MTSPSKSPMPTCEIRSPASGGSAAGGRGALARAHPQQFQRLALVAVLEHVVDPVEALQLETQRFGVALQHPGARLDDGVDAAP